jgi:hypothetical protein
MTTSNWGPPNDVQGSSEIRCRQDLHSDAKQNFPQGKNLELFQAQFFSLDRKRVAEPFIILCTADYLHVNWANPQPPADFIGAS